MRVDAEVHRSRFCTPPKQRSRQVTIENSRGQCIDSGQRRAGGGGIRGVGFHQHNRSLAAQQAPGEILRNVDHELHLAQLEHAFGLRFGANRAINRKIVGIAQGGRERAAKRPLVGGKHRGGQVLGIGIDGVAEKRELQQGNSHHHGKGHAIAPHLNEFLEHDGPETMEGEKAHGL